MKRRKETEKTITISWQKANKTKLNHLRGTVACASVGPVGSTTDLQQHINYQAKPISVAGSPCSVTTVESGSFAERMLIAHDFTHLAIIYP